MHRKTVRLALVAAVVSLAGCVHVKLPDHVVLDVIDGGIHVVRAIAEAASQSKQSETPPAASQPAGSSAPAEAPPIAPPPPPPPG